MSDQPTRNSPFAIFQSIFSLATPILVIVFGALINGNVNKMEAEIGKMKAEMDMQIAPVKEMKPFMDMLSDTTDRTKNIMGAYGIYMLKKGKDSKIAAQMISSTQKEHLFDVLIDISEDDTLVEQWINKFKENSAHISSDQLLVLEENDSSITLSDYQKYLLKLTSELEKSELNDPNKANDDKGSVKSEANDNADGWIYLGNINSKLIVQQPVNENTVKTLNKGANMRRGKPQPPNYKNQKLVRVLQQGSTVKLITVTEDKKGHIWAEVAVQDQ